VVRDRYIYLRQRTEQGLDGPQYPFAIAIAIAFAFAFAFAPWAV
jgi:hypothetical protein